MKSLYLISKPLQYFNATNIQDDNHKDLFVISYFEGAEQLKKRAELVKYWSEIKIFANYKQAFKEIDVDEYDKVFIDSDYGYSKFSFLKRFKHAVITVFEEGVGTYSNNLREDVLRNIKNASFFFKVKSWVVEKIYKILGNDDFHGGSKYTNHVLVYNIEKYSSGKNLKNKQVLNFKLSFSEHLNTTLVREVLYNNPIDFTNLESKRVLLYISQWTIDAKVYSYMDMYDKVDIKILKPHPHKIINKVTDERDESFLFDLILPGGVMIEYVLKDLIKSKCNLVVLHHGSSALEYLDGSLYKQVKI